MRVWVKLFSIICLAPIFSGCLSTLGAVGGMISGVNEAVSVIRYVFNREPKPSAAVKRIAYEEESRMGMKSVAGRFRGKKAMVSSLSGEEILIKYKARVIEETEDYITIKFKKANIGLVTQREAALRANTPGSTRNELNLNNAGQERSPKTVLKKDE